MGRDAEARKTEDELRKLLALADPDHTILHQLDRTKELALIPPRTFVEKKRRVVAHGHGYEGLSSHMDHRIQVVLPENLIQGLTTGSPDPISQ